MDRLFWRASGDRRPWPRARARPGGASSVPRAIRPRRIPRRRRPQGEHRSKRRQSGRFGAGLEPGERRGAVGDPDADGYLRNASSLASAEARDSVRAPRPAEQSPAPIGLGRAGIAARRCAGREARPGPAGSLASVPHRARWHRLRDRGSSRCRSPRVLKTEARRPPHTTREPGGYLWSWQYQSGVECGDSPERPTPGYGRGLDSDQSVRRRRVNPRRLPPYTPGSAAGWTEIAEESWRSPGPPTPRRIGPHPPAPSSGAAGPPPRTPGPAT